MKKMITLLFILTLLKFEVFAPPAITTDAIMQQVVAKSEEPYLKLVYVEKIRFTLKKKESRCNYYIKGGSGEIGAYQMMPSNYYKYCKRYFGSYREPSRHNQDTLAFCALKDLVEKGYTLEQIASIWNSGYPNLRKSGINFAGVSYDVGRYVREFIDLYEKVNYQWPDNNYINIWRYTVTDTLCFIHS